MPSEDKARELLDTLRQDVTCGACRAPFTAPVVLPCGHVFCSLCARRALSARSRCLEAHCSHQVTTLDLQPVHPLGIVAYRIDNRPAPDPRDVPTSRARRPHLPRSGRHTLSRNLAEVGLSIHGTAEELSTRYREFVMHWNANLDDVHPVSERTIVSRVTRAERELAAANNKQGAVFRRRTAIDSAAGDDSNQDAPNPGDTFATLTAKIRRRENRPPAGVYTFVPREPPDDGERAGKVRDEQEQIQDPANDRAVDLVPTASPTESDLAYADAAGAVSQRNRSTEIAPQSRNQVPPSPTESDLMLMAAAEQAESRSQELLQLNNAPQRHVVPPSTAYDSNGSQSTQPPTPQRTTPVRPHLNVQPPPPPPPVQQEQQQQRPTPRHQHNADNHASSANRPQPPLSQYGAGSITIGPRAAQAPRQAPPSTSPPPPARHNARYSGAPLRSSPHRPRPEPQTTNQRFHQPKVTPAQGATVQNNVQPPPRTSVTFSQAPMQTPAPTRNAFASNTPNGVVTDPLPQSVQVNVTWSQQVSNATQPSFSQPVPLVAAAPVLTDEVRERIERNRQRAIALQMAKRRRIEESRTAQLGGR